MAHHGIFRNPHHSLLVKRKHSHGEHVGRDENGSEESPTLQTTSHGTAIPESNSDGTSGLELQDITQRDITYNVSDSSQSSTNGGQGSMAITMTNTNSQTTSLDTTATPLPTSTSESDVSQSTTSNDSTSSSEVVSSTTSSGSSSTTTDTSAVTSDYESTTVSTASTASTTSLSSSDSSSSTYVSFQVSTSLIASAETLHPSSSIPTVKPSMLIIATSSTSLSQTTPTSTTTLSLSSSSDSDYGLGFIPASTSTSSSSTSSYTSATTTSWTSSSTTSSSTLTSNSTTYLDSATITTGTGGQWAGGGGSDATGTGQIPSATASQSPSSSGSSTTNKIVGGVVGAVAGAFVLLAFLFLLLRRRQATLRQATRGLSASDGAAGAGGEGSISRAEMASRRSSNDPLFLASYLAPAFMQRWRQSSQSTRSDSTSSERGFQKISGRKIPSVLQSGGDGYGGGFEEESPTASEPSVSIPPGSPVHPRSPISQPPPSMPFGMPLDASYTREAEEPNPFVVFRPSPARMAVASTPPSASRAAIPQRPDGLGRSHPSFDGSRGSRFTESLEGL